MTFGPAFLGPAFSTPDIWSFIFNPAFSVLSSFFGPPFSSPAFSVDPDYAWRRIRCRNLSVCLSGYLSILFYSILKNHDYGDVSAGAQPVLVYCTIGDYMIVMGMRSF